VQPPDRPAAAERPVRRLEPLAVEEVAAVFKPPANARTMSGPSKPARGERIQASFCYERISVADAAKAFAASLAQDGWQDLHVRAHPRDADRISLAGQKPPFRLTGAVRRGEVPDCAAADGHSFVAVTIHKINPALFLQPGQARSIGGLSLPSKVPPPAVPRSVPAPAPAPAAPDAP
jgi:hypothetical protein